MKIILYSTNCGKCGILKEELARKDVDFELNTNRQEMINLGMKSAPGLRVDDKLFDFTEAMDFIRQGGFDED